jgi:hypothetical protein
MYREELKIKCQTLAQTGDSEFFEVAWSPDHVYYDTSNNCDYESVLRVINKSSPAMIVIDPEGMDSITLVRFVHDLQEKYNLSTREVERGGEFVEKYSYYELILQLKQKVLRN